MRAVRLVDEPIIRPESHRSIGTNIQGPSLVRVPDWVESPLGRYYLYFADHKGRYIRLAYADELAGPWAIHEPGSLQLGDSWFCTEPPELDDATYQSIAQGYEAALGESMPFEIRDDLVVPHIASPDVHVDDGSHTILMYFHGLEGVANQQSRVATSSDGINFAAGPELLGPSYFRVFRHGDWHYSLAMPGVVLRSADGRTGFAKGPTLFDTNMRHSAVRVRGDTLDVFWTKVTDAPERIYHSTVDIGGDWMTWSESQPVEVLRPERRWEGASLDCAASRRGAVSWPVNQLRDPAIFAEDGRCYLLYAVAGESGIAIAELHD